MDQSGREPVWPTRRAVSKRTRARGRPAGCWYVTEVWAEHGRLKRGKALRRRDAGERSPKCSPSMVGHRLCGTSSHAQSPPRADAEGEHGGGRDSASDRPVGGFHAKLTEEVSEEYGGVVEMVKEWSLTLLRL